MLALLLVSLACLLGLLVTALVLDQGLGPWTRVGVGLACGQALLLWLPFLCSLLSGISARGAGYVSLVLFAAGVALGSLALVWRRPELLRRWSRDLLAEARQRGPRALALFGGGFLVLYAWLLQTHYLSPQPDGLHSAGVTWWDLTLHAGVATSFRDAPGWVSAEHPFMAGQPLAYPLLADYSVAVLSALGLPLRWAFVLSGWPPMLAFVLGLPGLVRLWTGDSRPLVAGLGLGLFLFAGGLGCGLLLWQLLQGTPPLELLASANATYSSPLVLKSGHIGNLFLASRTSAFGMSIAVAALLVLSAGLLRPGEQGAPPAATDLGSADPAAGPAGSPAAGPTVPELLLTGSLAGCLPLLHSHSFVMFGGLFACYVLLWRRLGARWLWCLGPYLALGIPQGLWLTSAAQGGSVRLEIGFLRPAESVSQWIVDLGVGMGVGLLLLPFAWRQAKDHTWRLAGPLLLLLPLVNLGTFTPSPYDNVKFLAWFDVALACFLAPFLADLAQRRRALAGALVLSCTLSGLLAVGYELSNDKLFMPSEDVAFVEVLRAETPPGAVIASAGPMHDPVAVLSGRRPLLSGRLILVTSGVPFRRRNTEVVELYAGGPSALEVIERHAVHGVVVGPREHAELPTVNEVFLRSQARRLVEVGQRRLYLLR